MKWLGLFLALTAAAQEPPPPPSVREISPGIYEIGRVRVDRAHRTISFPARVNRPPDFLEYALVARGGKAHESLLVTEAAPLDLHVAALLLGLKPTAATVPAPEKLDDAFLQNTPELTGTALTIAVGWQAAAGPRTAALESLILNRRTNAAAEAGAWLYTGSQLDRGKFRAQVDGSIIALVLDPSALINNPRGSDRDDEAWVPNLPALPAEGTSVDITLFLPEIPPP